MPHQEVPLRRFAIAPLIALLALLIVAAPASAGVAWCSRDPVLKVNGQVVDVLVSSYTGMTASANGPLRLTVTVPSGVSASVIASDNGFGYGYTISVKTSTTLKASSTSIPVRVEVYAPAKDSTLPVKVDITPRSTGPVHGVSVQGHANQWVTAQTK
jgi:hypothetical protein